MKPFKYLIFLSLTALLFVSAVHAQEEPDGDQPRPQWQNGGQPPVDIRGNALRQLGLSKEQTERIQQINIDRRLEMEAAQKRLHEANRALDAAIYADVVNDADVEAKLSEVNAAQNAVARLRFMNELAVRRVLTPEQLVRFRELRHEFELHRQEFRRRRMSDGARPVQRRGDRQQRPHVPTQQPISRPVQ